MEKIKWNQYKKPRTMYNDYEGEVSCSRLGNQHLDEEIKKRLNLDTNHIIIGYELCFGVPTDKDVLINVQLIKKDKIATCVSNVHKKRKLNIKTKKINIKFSLFVKLVEFTVKMFPPKILNKEKDVILESKN